jgi:hypothetical protein
MKGLILVLLFVGIAIAASLPVEQERLIADADFSIETSLQEYKAMVLNRIKESISMFI